MRRRLCAGLTVAGCRAAAPCASGVDDGSSTSSSSRPARRDMAMSTASSERTPCRINPTLATVYFNSLLQARGRRAVRRCDDARSFMMALIVAIHLSHWAPRALARPARLLWKPSHWHPRHPLLALLAARRAILLVLRLIPHPPTQSHRRRGWHCCQEAGRSAMEQLRTASRPPGPHRHRRILAAQTVGSHRPVLAGRCAASRHLLQQHHVTRSGETALARSVKGIAHQNRFQATAMRQSVCWCLEPCRNKLRASPAAAMVAAAMTAAAALPPSRQSWGSSSASHS